MALVQALPVTVTDHPNPGLDVQQCRPLSSHSPSGPCPGPCGPCSSGTAMGSVSSLISGRTYQERHCRAASEFTTKSRRSTPATSCFRLQDNTLRSGSSLEQLLVISNQTQPQAQVLPPPLPTKKQPRPGNTAGAGGGTVAGAVGGGTNGNFGHVSDEVVVGDWNDNVVLAATSPYSDSEDQRDNRTLNGNIGGPPPKLIPVSGQLEKNMEKVLIRPTAFKPVVPKNRHSVHYLSPRPGGSSLSESQASLNLLLPLGGSNSAGGTTNIGGSSSSSEGKRSSYSGRNARSSQSCSMSDSGRNSLSSLPTHSSTGYSLAPSEGSSSGSGSGGQLEPVTGLGRNTSGGSASHGHSNSDSGRSSSSKSTGSGSLSGRGQPLSDSGSCGHSPPPVEGYEGVVRELEEKLRERDLELQQLRENLDENEAAICQVYEEKQRRCESEMEELRQSCAAKMKQASQKAQRAQQVLQLQVFQLQQEKKKLQEDFSSLLQDRETLERRCATIQREQTQLGPRLEETKWEVCQKSGEISLLKQQLKENQSELSQKAGDIVVLKAQLREARSELQASQVRSQEAQAALRTRSLELEVCENELQRRKSEAELLREKLGRLDDESARLRDTLSNHSGNATVKGQCMSLSLQQGRGVTGRGGPSPCVYRDGEETHLVWGGESDEAKAQRQNAETVLGLRQQVDRLKAELMYERRTSEEHLSRFEDERRVWQEEKEKVIRYQKQLQQNYIQMYRRNRDLERVMRELSLELENRDMEDYEVHSGSNDIHFEEITATEI
ncbi:leucine zipper putative tumor suppressor 2 homolog [Acanthopagrus latus]|uniref:leucine zipper putative tumor suppressor 2 homolog n=1 Tax=Acanthopagrus latus TaxID=8177 RepID=UPI00187C097B|nr:leucine zipper putative tumor suppressor 2 homolog [Acanthopagrus latus]XP_036980579.1 leucine zipper putative tumor suppressor 2 homolog [Acanthopagrus latus]XP_036980580.1 leucine zipper putative tumor suppressor 2 homolog [Acanthopagrus latus]XP_036980581.1 leucine zipper putative tumor suppressor 2 homolog [Acanthopagrus latus]XP_036980582.1 leucine zipper putative tumor suppressor 2 homolog [Acanthopagrus latus]XP_036980583.1 leucine zipper putative tumor suppressor 2 homolog [Acanthop